MEAEEIQLTSYKNDRALQGGMQHPKGEMKSEMKSEMERGERVKIDGVDK
jgi:hypothetical protein